MKVYALSSYISSIDVVAGAPINEWFKLMGMGMKWDIIGLQSQDNIVKMGRAIKRRNEIVAEMQALEAASPHLRKLVKILKKQRTI